MSSSSDVIEIPFPELVRKTFLKTESPIACDNWSIFWALHNLHVPILGI